MKLGARILKTGIAVTLALYMAKLFHFPSPVFTGIAAVFAIQPTIHRSYVTVIEQIQGNIIGTVIAISFTLMFGDHYFIVGFAAMIAIAIMLKLKLESSIRLAVVTIIAVMEAPADNFLQFASLRSTGILVGILSAFIVNLIFIPPKYETKLFQNISGVTEEILKWLRLTSRFAYEDSLLKKDLGKFKDRISSTNLLYTMYKEERRYFKRNDFSKGRKLVIYKQMIQAAQKSYELLKMQQRYENILHQLPEKVQVHTRERLDFLLSYHEQLLLKFLGRVRDEIDYSSLYSGILTREQLMDAFIKEIRQGENDDDYVSFHLMQVLSSILEYEEQLEHLDKMVTTFQRFHKKASKIIIKDE